MTNGARAALAGRHVPDSSAVQDGLLGLGAHGEQPEGPEDPLGEHDVPGLSPQLLDDAPGDNEARVAVREPLARAMKRSPAGIETKAAGMSIIDW